MKILHLIYDHINNPWVGGGGAVRCYELNKRLVKMGHKVTVLTGYYPNAQNYREGDLEFYFVGSGKSYTLSVFSYTYEAIKFLKKYGKNFDLIVEDFAPWNPVFSFLFHNKLVLQVHHKEGVEIIKRYNLAGLPFYLIEKFYPKIFKNIIAVSEISLKKFRIKGVVIPNGIDENIIQDNVLLGDYIGFIGRIDIYNKGLDIILQAIKDIDVKLKIAGKGKDEKKLKEMIRFHNLDQKVEFLGFLYEEDKIKFIKNSLFMIMPSRYEGQGIVALESAAVGKPVIVSNIPGLSYVTENGFGLSFQKESYTDLRDKIIYLLKQPELILQLGKNGINYAKKLTWNNLSCQYEKYLTDFIRDDK
ncbi:glycosyltransferase family 4 protein [Sulfurihydrogenibium sp.]|uniref:glycosyltransferase family 4 protein n=1 Tax=Sulfurihydrogenibium sp. TaxID=2053621 RepID=UPI003D0B426F